MLFTFKDVTYDYTSNSRFHLGPLSLTLPSDQLTALVGSNGSGKTTMIRVLLNELVNYSGTYSIDNTEIRDLTGSVPHQFGIGYAPEDPVLDEALSGYEILSIIKEIHGIDTALFEKQLEQFRSLLQLDTWFESSPCSEYSQGMRRKTSLMIAMTGAMNFAIIDEPTNGLDPLAVFGLKRLVAGYKEQGRGALISSHMLDFVEKIAENIIILKKGSIAFAGKVKDLMEMHPEKPLDEIYFHIFANDTVPGLSETQK